jgi:hypothetical protein
VSDEPFLELTSTTIACPDPRALAAFYSRLLRAEVTASDPPLPGEPETAGWAQVAAGDLRVNFEFEVDFDELHAVTSWTGVGTGSGSNPTLTRMLGVPVTCRGVPTMIRLASRLEAYSSLTRPATPGPA